MPALIWPLRGNPPITSPYGPRSGGFHTGVDFGVRTGTIVVAAAAGQARRATNPGGGKGVIIDHGDGMSTEYWHLGAQAIASRQGVAQGAIIGFSGASGLVTGPHLHFEVKVNGRHVDPMPYLRGGVGNPTTSGLPPFVPVNPDGTCPAGYVKGQTSGVVRCVLPEAQVGLEDVPGVIAGAALDVAIPVVLNVGVVLAAAALGWSGVQKVLGVER
jgi:hypothetical protein